MAQEYELDIKVYEKIKAAVAEAVAELGKNVSGDFMDIVTEVADVSRGEAKQALTRMESDGSWAAL